MIQKLKGGILLDSIKIGLSVYSQSPRASIITKPWDFSIQIEILTIIPTGPILCHKNI